MQSLRLLSLFEYRVLARLIDYLIWGCLSAVFTLIPHPWLIRDTSDFPFLFHVGFCLLYYPVLEATGGTMGKRILGLATKKAGNPQKNLTLFQSLAKTTCQFTPVLVFYFFTHLVNYGTPLLKTLFDLDILLVPVFILSPLSLFFTGDHRTLHDKWSHSVVIRKVPGRPVG